MNDLFSPVRLDRYYGEAFKVECPTGSGRMLTLLEVAKEIGERLTRTFLRDTSGRRPVYGSERKFLDDPLWRDSLQFYEYFHGDNGVGIGASHQTGWTGLVARIIQTNALLSPELLLAPGAEVAVLKRAAGAHSTNAKR